MDNVTNISLRERVKQWLASYHKTLRDKRKKERWFHLSRVNGGSSDYCYLAAVAMPQFLSAGDKARDAKIKADTQTIANAAQLYMVDRGTDEVPSVEDLYKAGYLSEAVKTPKGGDYAVTSESNAGGTGTHIVVTATDNTNAN